MKYIFYIMIVLLSCTFVNNSSKQFHNSDKFIELSSTDYFNELYLKEHSNEHDNEYFETFDYVTYKFDNDIRNAFIGRSITMNIKDSLLFRIFDHIVYNHHYLFIIFKYYNVVLDNCYTSIKWMYLGKYLTKYLTKSKHSISNFVKIVTKPRTSLLILILLLMCGDTGCLINPGPIALNSNLDLIDPDHNHFEPSNNFQSHSMTSFSSKQDINANSLKLIHHNARSLMTDCRMDEYVSLFKILKHPFDILVFTETWLKKEEEGQCKFDCYNHVHLLRPVDEYIDFKERGGGISIFVKNNLDFTHRTDLTIMTPFAECSFIEMKFNNHKYLIGGIYRTPDTDIVEFMENFNCKIEPLKSSHKIILLGDFNIDLLKNDRNKHYFELCLQSNYLLPTILSPTRVATRMINNKEITTKTLIDNILINHNIQYQSGIIETSITDHYSVYIVVTDINKANTVPHTIQYRINNYKCQRKFNFYLIQYGIENILNNHIAQTAYNTFNDIFQKSYNRSFPIKSKIIKEKDIQKPWITETFISKIKKRDRLYKLLTKKKIPRTEYSNYRNKLTIELREAKTKYFENQFEMNSNNIKKTWETINSIIKSKKVHSKTFLVDDDNIDIEENDIPNKFINYYSNIPLNLISNIPSSHHNAASYLQNRINKNFTISPICPIEVNTIIDNLKDNGNKVNTICTSVLVESKHIITPIICHLINLFVQQGFFPEHLKLGCITPIFKSGDKKKINNYRPVCSLSPISKIIEKVVNNRMVDFIEDQEIFSNTQFGFRKNMCTETALKNYIDYIQN